MEKTSLMNDTNNWELVIFRFALFSASISSSQVNYLTIPSYKCSEELHGDKVRCTNAFAAALSPSSLEVSSKSPNREFLSVQTRSSITAMAKLIKSTLIKLSVKSKITFVIKNVLETHPAPAQADERMSQMAALEYGEKNVFQEFDISFSLSSWLL